MRAQRVERRRRLGLDQLDLDAGVRRAQRDHRGQQQVQARGLERADAHDAFDGAGGGGREVGLGALRGGEQLLGVGDEDERRVGEPDAPAGGNEQRGPGLALELWSCWETVLGL